MREERDRGWGQADLTPRGRAVRGPRPQLHGTGPAVTQVVSLPLFSPHLCPCTSPSEQQNIPSFPLTRNCRDCLLFLEQAFADFFFAFKLFFNSFIEISLIYKIDIIKVYNLMHVYIEK